MVEVRRGVARRWMLARKVHVDDAGEELADSEGRRHQHQVPWLHSNSVLVGEVDSLSALLSSA
jgi:hypothetical protein